MRRLQPLKTLKNADSSPRRAPPSAGAPRGAVVLRAPHHGPRWQHRLAVGHDRHQARGAVRGAQAGSCMCAMGMRAIGAFWDPPCLFSRLLLPDPPCVHSAARKRRALALKQISNRDTARVCLKEAGAGCMMGERARACVGQCLWRGAPPASSRIRAVGRKSSCVAVSLPACRPRLQFVCSDPDVGLCHAGYLPCTPYRCMCGWTHPPSQPPALPAASPGALNRRRAGPVHPGLLHCVVGHIYRGRRRRRHRPAGELLRACHS